MQPSLPSTQKVPCIPSARQYSSPAFADIPDMDVLAFLGAWVLMARSHGSTIKLRGEAKTLGALQLLGFHQLLDIPASSTNVNVQPAKAPVVGVLPLTPIATEKQQFQDVDAICAIANVAAECLHTGGRAPAKLLRRKIQGLLPAMDGEPLILDFRGVKSAASSFLDELLGRLADEDPRGQAIFDGPVRIQGMTPTVQAMANVVVAQRLKQRNSSRSLQRKE
jgi:hypothetical protein